MNKGMSLIEVTIGMSLFAILMVLVIETTLSIRDFSANYEENITLEEEGRRIIRQVTADFSNSARLNIFPTLSPGISATTYGNSVPVEFLRLRSNGPDLSQVGIAAFDFKTPTSRMIEWKTPSSTVSGLVINKDYGDGINTDPLASQVWEPIAGLRDNALSFSQNKTLSFLRRYRYKVTLDNNSIGRGVLKREFSDTAGVTWDLDTSIGELGRHIHWFIIQVDPPATGQRVRLFLELRGPEKLSGNRAVRQFSAVIAMRSMP